MAFDPGSNFWLMWGEMNNRVFHNTSEPAYQVCRREKNKLLFGVGIIRVVPMRIRGGYWDSATGLRLFFVWAGW